MKATLCILLILCCGTTALYAQNDSLPDTADQQVSPDTVQPTVPKPSINILPTAQDQKIKRIKSKIHLIEQELNRLQKVQQNETHKTLKEVQRINQQLHHIDSLQSQAQSQQVFPQLQRLDTLSQIAQVPQQTQSQSPIFTFGKIWRSLLVMLFILALIFITSKVLRVMADRSQEHREQYLRSIPLVRLSLLLLGIVIIILWIFPPPLEIVMIISGAVAVALGLGAQPNLKNMFAGLSILVKAPFAIGDNISVGDHVGIIQEIGFTVTILLSPDDTLIHIPNSLIITDAITNTNNGHSYSQVIATIYLPNHIDINKAKSIAKETAQTSRYIYLNKPIVVWFENEMADKPFLKMSLKAYVLDIKFANDFKSDMTEILLTELYNHQLV